MPELTDDPTLAARLAALESRVTALQQQVERLQNGPTVRPAAPPPPPRFVVPRPARPPRDAAARVRSALKTEDWLNKLGIALLIFGVIFFFKYSIDQGWLGPPVRVACGGALGAFLLGAGFRLRPSRKRLGQVLLGGGLATFYTTIFAAFQFYALVSYPLAAAGMTAVTLLAFALAHGQDDAVLAVVATLGGLLTPFLLYTGEGNVPGLVIYTCLVLAGAGGMYFFKGWRTLLGVAAVGGWLVFVAVWFDITFDGGALGDEPAFHFGIVFWWLAVGVMPAVREVLHQGDPGRWPVPPPRFLARFDVVMRPALWLAVVAPLLALTSVYEIWEDALPPEVRGLIIAGLAALYGVAYVLLRNRGLPKLASAHGLTAALLLAFSVFELFGSYSLEVIALGLEVVALHLLARANADRVLRAAGHAFVVLLVFIFLDRLSMAGQQPVLVNGRALADLLVLGAVFFSATTLKGRTYARLYRLLAYVGFLAWLWRDLAALDNGQGYVSLAWGLVALTLLALGWRRDADLPRNVGLLTLLFVVGKLFIVDLASLDAVWRFLLFLALGGLILLLSFLFPRLWRPEAAPEPAETEALE